MYLSRDVQRIRKGGVEKIVKNRKILDAFSAHFCSIFAVSMKRLLIFCSSYFTYIDFMICAGIGSNT